MKFRLYAVGILMLLGLPMAGCSSDEDFLAGSSASQTGVPNLIVGRVAFGEPATGVEVVAVGPDGQRLTPLGLKTDSNGFFFLPKPLPLDSKVSVDVAVVSSSPEVVTLQARVKGEGQRQKISMNFPLHLAARLRDRDPSLEQSEAEAEVSRLLKIGSDKELDTLEESPVSPFHHGVFLQEAAKAGGVEPLTAQLLELSDRGGTRGFTLGVGLGDAETITLGSVVEALARKALGFAEGEFEGWVIRLLSSAFASPSDPFAGVEGQITNLGNELNSISTQFQAETVYTNLLNQVTSPISAAVADLRVANTSFVTPVPPLSLYSLGAGQSLLQALQKANYEQALVTLFQTLTGTDTLVTTYSSTDAVDLRPERTFAKLTYPIVGIDSVLNQYSGYGAFSFHTTYPMEQLHDYYLDYATLASNLLAETAHSVVDGTQADGQSLARACREAQLELLGTSESMGVAARRKQVQQLLPPSLAPVTTQVFIDREYGLMWFTEAVGGLTYQQAVSVASTMQNGPYKDGWRLPYKFELDQLYSRIKGGWINRTAAQRNGSMSNVLRDLGFDLSQLSSAREVWGLYYDFGNLQWKGYSLDKGEFATFDSSSTQDVLFVRSYVETTSNSAFADPELSPVASAPLNVSSQVGPGGTTQLSASMDFECPIGGAFTINGTTINPTYGSNSTGLNPSPISGAAPGSQRPNKDITTRVVWSSSNDAIALISNLEGEEGKVYWRTPSPNGAQSCTFTASFQGTTGSVTLSRPSDLQWVVDSILLTPDQAAVTLNGDSSSQVLFIATVFMKNPATGDRTAFRSSAVGGEAPAPQVTWSLETTAGTPIPSGFANPQSSLLSIKATDTTENQVIVKAEAGGVTQQTTLYLLK